MALWKRTDNWLAGIADANHPSHTIHELNGLSVKDCQAAFDATYGKNKFNVRDHGSVITVWSNIGMVRKLQESRQFWLDEGRLDAVAEKDKMIEKYQRRANGESEED